MKFIAKPWAVRYRNEQSFIALSYKKKCPKFNKDDCFTPFNDPNYFDVIARDLGNIKLPLNKPVRLRLTVERIK